MLPLKSSARNGGYKQFIVQWKNSTQGEEKHTFKLFKENGKTYDD